MTIHQAKQFSVDSEGAYLVNLCDKAGKPILFPRATIGGKRRGGAHVCSPYFGPDAAGVLPQHGFGRDVEWDITVQGDREIICTYQENSDELFAGLHATIAYKLSEDSNSFSTTLIVTNNGYKTFPVTPGFHPYFAVDSNDVRLNGEQVSLADFEPFKEFPGNQAMTVESGGRAVTVSSETLQHMVVWTDLRGEYLCVEPTLAGNAFDSTKPDIHLLQPTEVVVCAYSLAWS